MKFCLKTFLALLISIYATSCSSTKSNIAIENEQKIENNSLNEFVDSAGIDSVNNFLDSAEVQNLSLNDLKIVYTNIKNTNSINERLVLKRILFLEKDKALYIQYSSCLADIESLLDNDYIADSIYESLIAYAEDSVDNSTKYLAKIYYNFGNMKFKNDEFKKSIRLFAKSSRYADAINDSLLMAKSYTKLNEIYYYDDNIRSSMINYFKAFPIRINLKEYDKAIILTSQNFIYHKSKGMKLNKFAKEVYTLDSLARKFDTSNKIRYLLMRATFVDNINNIDTALFSYYKELDSLYFAEHKIFSEHVSDYVETFFPILNRLKKFDEAKKLMDNVIKDFNISQDSIINAETVNMAFWAYNTGQFGKSQQLFKKALKEYEQKYGKDSPILAELLDKVGVMYLQSGLTLEAYNFFDRALTIKEKHSDGDYLSMGISYNNIAESYRVGGEYRFAEKNYYLAIDSWEKLSPDSSNQWLTKAFHNLGVLYTDMGIYDTAKISLDKAYKYKKNIFGNNSPELIFTYIAMGKLYFKTTQFDSSLVAYNEAERIIKHTGLTNTLYDLSYRIGLGLLYAFMGDKNVEAKENLLWAERYILSMEGFQEDKLRDIRKILLNIAKREDDEAEEERISKELFGEDDWDD